MPKKISSKKKKGKPTPVNFQDTILNLQSFGEIMDASFYNHMI